MLSLFLMCVKQSFKMAPMTFTLGVMPMIMEYSQKDLEDEIKVIN